MLVTSGKKKINKIKKLNTANKSTYGKLPSSSSSGQVRA
jgi:hypothetical protein